MLKYDEVMNKQRTVIYDERRRVLDGEDLHIQVQNMIDDVITAYVDGATATGLRRGLGHRHAVDGAQDAVPDLGDARSRSPPSTVT